jgi:DNA replication and repair protein RecF
MTVLEVHLTNWRNLKKTTLIPNQEMNVIYGANAQGKTNLLEALWMCSGARSFRGAKDNELIGFDQKGAKITMKFLSHGREQVLEYKFGEKKEILLNGVEKKSPSELFGTVFAVVFAPNHLGLVKDGPAARRQFIDFALSRLKPTFQNLEEQYQRALDQRNALLRELHHAPQMEGLLDLWEDALARLGSTYARQREKYVATITPFATKFYYELSGGQEELGLSYDGSHHSSDNGGYETLLKELKDSRETDKKMGYTTVGPHRHDLNITINGISARTFGSQGQQRSAALALKMAEAEVLSDYVEEKPIILLDDVMSELDNTRQDYLLNKFSSRQIFITCCDPASVLRLKQGKCFYIEQGELCEKTVEE